MAKKRINREIVLVRPSELRKDVNITVRVNSTVKKLLKGDLSPQKIFDEAIDKKLQKVEFEEKTTVEIKKTTK